MKLFTIEHRQAGAIFLAIFALAAMIFFSSCSVARREGTTSPCYAKQFKATKVVKRKCY